MRDPKAYAKKVESYVERYAQADDADRAGDGEDDEDDVVGNSPKNRRGIPTPAAAGSSGAARPVNGSGNGVSNGNGHAAANGINGNGSSNGNANGKAHKGSDDEDDGEDDNMSDMGELSDGDEFMGEMDD